MDWATNIDRMVAGYRESSLLIFGVKSGLFESLETGPLTAKEIAADRGLDERATGVVLHALCSLEVLEKEGDRFTIAAGARPYLLAGGTETKVSIIGHHRSLLRKWTLLDEVLQTGEPAPRNETTEEEMRDFILGMENVSRSSSEEVAEKIDLSGCRRLLDLGGGPGTASLIFARANPDLDCVVFDLPGPVAIADEQIAKAGLEGRVSTMAGDFHTDPLGGGFDVVYIANILHMMGPEEASALVNRAASALAPGGRLLVKDFFLDESRTSPSFAAQFSVNMLVATRGGRSYTRGDAERMFTAAGLAVSGSWTVATHSLVIEARRESLEAGGV